MGIGEEKEWRRRGEQGRCEEGRGEEEEGSGEEEEWRGRGHLRLRLTSSASTFACRSAKMRARSSSRLACSSACWIMRLACWSRIVCPSAARLSPRTLPRGFPSAACRLPRVGGGAGRKLPILPGKDSSRWLALSGGGPPPPPYIPYPPCPPLTSGRSSSESSSELSAGSGGGMRPLLPKPPIPPKPVMPPISLPSPPPPPPAPPACSPPSSAEKSCPTVEPCLCAAP